MLSNKLYTLLQTLSKQDLQRFKKFIHSPYFNENQQLILLFELIHPFLKETTKQTALTKENTWTVLFPNQSYSDTKMRRLCSDLTKQVYTFLSIQKFKEEELVQKSFLLDTLNDATLTKQYDSVYNSMQKDSSKTITKSANYHYYQHLLLANQYLYQAKQRKPFLDVFKSADHHLDCFYFLTKLKNYCAELGNKSSIQISEGMKILPNLFPYLEQENFAKVPSIKAYLLVIKLLTEPEKEDFFWTLKEFIATEGSISKGDLNELYAHLMNYCANKLNGGNTDYYLHLFDLYKVALDKKVIIEKDRLDFQQYKNIVGIGLKVQAYDWVEQFIQKYTQYLIPSKRENALNFNLAKVYFSQQQYEKVIEQLSTVTYKNHIYAIGGKTILIKTYFELKEYQALDSLIDSFRIYIRRNKIISREVQQQNLNFLRFVKKIAGTLPKDTSSIDKITNQIHKCKALAGKKWILEKVAELV